MVNIQNEFHPDYAISPGEVLSVELGLRGMTQQELAKRTGITPKHIISILKAKSALTPETALKFERALGMPVEYWLNLEAHYQEILARVSEEVELERNIDWLKRIPISAMMKFGWIDKTKNKKAQLIEVLRFFGIANVDQWDEMWPNLNVAYRQNQTHEVFPEAVSAWLRKGEIQSSNIHCEPYNKAKFREALNKIRGLTTEDPAYFIPAMQELCATAGVAIIFVPALPKTGVSGATRWLNKNKAIIQLSLRYKTDDHLWFTFFHEAGHILLHGKKELFLEGTNGLDQNKEHEANVFAEHELIPTQKFSKFIANRDFKKISIVSFAKAVGVSPGIVVGQLQHRGLLNIRFCNDLKQRFEWVHE